MDSDDDVFVLPSSDEDFIIESNDSGRSESDFIINSSDDNIKEGSSDENFSIESDDSAKAENSKVNLNIKQVKSDTAEEEEDEAQPTDMLTMLKQIKKTPDVNTRQEAPLTGVASESIQGSEEETPDILSMLKQVNTRTDSDAPRKPSLLGTQSISPSTTTEHVIDETPIEDEPTDMLSMLKEVKISTDPDHQSQATVVSPVPDDEEEDNKIQPTDMLSMLKKVNGSTDPDHQSQATVVSPLSEEETPDILSMLKQVNTRTDSDAPRKPSLLRTQSISPSTTTEHVIDETPIEDEPTDMLSMLKEVKISTDPDHQSQATVVSPVPDDEEEENKIQPTDMLSMLKQIKKTPSDTRTKSIRSSEDDEISEGSSAHIKLFDDDTKEVKQATEPSLLIPTEVRVQELVTAEEINRNLLQPTDSLLHLIQVWEVLQRSHIEITILADVFNLMEYLNIQFTLTQNIICNESSRMAILQRESCVRNEILSAFEDEFHFVCLLRNQQQAVVLLTMKEDCIRRGILSNCDDSFEYVNYLQVQKQSTVLLRQQEIHLRLELFEESQYEHEVLRYTEEERRVEIENRRNLKSNMRKKTTIAERISAEFRTVSFTDATTGVAAGLCIVAVALTRPSIGFQRHSAARILQRMHRCVSSKAMIKKLRQNREHHLTQKEHSQIRSFSATVVQSLYRSWVAVKEVNTMRNRWNSAIKIQRRCRIFLRELKTSREKVKIRNLENITTRLRTEVAQLNNQINVREETIRQLLREREPTSENLIFTEIAKLSNSLQVEHHSLRFLESKFEEFTGSFFDWKRECNDHPHVSERDVSFRNSSKNYWTESRPQSSINHNVTTQSVRGSVPISAWNARPSEEPVLVTGQVPEDTHLVNLKSKNSSMGGSREPLAWNESRVSSGDIKQKRQTPQSDVSCSHNTSYYTARSPIVDVNESFTSTPDDGWLGGDTSADSIHSVTQRDNYLFERVPLPTQTSVKFGVKKKLPTGQKPQKSTSETPKSSALLTAALIYGSKVLERNGGF